MMILSPPHSMLIRKDIKSSRTYSNKNELFTYILSIKIIAIILSFDRLLNINY